MTTPRTEAQTVTLVINGEPPRSMNQQERLHWSKRRQYRALWRSLVGAEWTNAGQPLFAGTVEMTVRLYYRTNRRRDPDNIIGSLKPVIDGLVGCGCLADDNALLLLLNPPVIAVDRERPRLEIEIVDREGASDAG